MSYQIKINLKLTASDKPQEYFYFFKQKGNLKNLLDFADSKPTVSVPLKDIRWILNDLPYPINRDQKYSLMRPIPIVHWNGQLIALHYFEQIYYANKVGAYTMLAKLISAEELKKFFINLPKIARDIFDLQPLPESHLIPIDSTVPLSDLEEIEVTEAMQQLVPPIEGRPTSGPIRS